MFVSFDDGASWQPFSLNLPATPVTDMKVVNKDLALSTMGRGFWILYDLSPLHEMSPQLAAADVHLFKVRAALRLHDFDFAEFPRPPEPDEPQYPPAGANLHYWLGKEPAGELKLEILDAAGKLVREFSSAAAGEHDVTPAEPGMREWRLERVGTRALPKTRGLHRFVWDLRHAGPWHSNRERSGRRGPLAAPGTYQARLSAGGSSQTVPFEVKLDPRVAREGVTQADVVAQAELSLKARDAVSNARALAAQLEKAQKEAPAGSDAARRLGEIKRALVTAPVRYSQPMLLDQLEYLYQNLGRADHRPNADAVQRYEELNSTLQLMLRAMEQLQPARAASGQ